MRSLRRFILSVSVVLVFASNAFGQDATVATDRVKDLQTEAMEKGKADWGHWGSRPAQYNAWKNHSSRLIPVYTFGLSLDSLRTAGSLYRDPARVAELYTRPLDLPADPNADYFDQTDIYQLQRAAIAAGKKHVILVVFDGMDWQTTQAAAIYQTGKVAYTEGRGTGLAFQDYGGAASDFGYFATSPISAEPKVDVDGQVIISGVNIPAGYDPRLGGKFPWSKPARPEYLLGTDKENPAPVTDSSASATSMTAGIKTFNGAVNYNIFGSKVETVAHWAQREKQMAIGVVTSVPISHATPASAYSHNVSRDDYQDLTRDLLGLPSISNKRPLPGVDVLMGAGWGEMDLKDKDKQQGMNFIPGNKYLTDEDLKAIDATHGGKYVVAQRTPGKPAVDVLREQARKAVSENQRFFGFFGVKSGHLPFRTADGRFDPTKDIKAAEEYSPEDLVENPTLADMTASALYVLQDKPNGFWLMVEAGDVDWANHSNNIDNSIGAVISGDAAFQTIVKWVEQRNAWKETVVIVTSDHGHFFNLVKPEVLAHP